MRCEDKIEILKTQIAALVETIKALEEKSTRLTAVVAAAIEEYDASRILNESKIDGGIRLMQIRRWERARKLEGKALARLWDKTMKCGELP